jgi:hypothetical protein
MARNFSKLLSSSSSSTQSSRTLGAVLPRQQSLSYTPQLAQSSGGITQGGRIEKRSNRFDIKNYQDDLAFQQAFDANQQRLSESASRTDLDRERFELSKKDQADLLKFGQDKFAYTKFLNEQNRDDRLASGKSQADIIRTGYGAMLQAWNQNTGQLAADIRSDFNDQEASGMQALGRTGLSNTTIAPTLKLGYQRSRQAALRRNADASINTKIGIIKGKTDALTRVATGYERGA